MVTTIHLGVNEVPYETPPKAAKTKNKVTAPTSKTTYDVAQILEAKYHVMELFFRFALKDEDIGGKLKESLVGALENQLGGTVPVTFDPFGKFTEHLQSKFSDFILLQQVEQLGIPGLPTKAALHGVSHRFDKPYAKRPSRPSLYDTGFYSGNFRAWVD